MSGDHDEIYITKCPLCNKHDCKHEPLIVDGVMYKQLQAENEKLRKCVEFYAKPNSHYTRGLVTYTKYVDDSDRHSDMGYSLVRIGKRARQCLKEIEEK